MHTIFCSLAAVISARQSNQARLKELQVKIHFTCTLQLPIFVT